MKLLSALALTALLGTSAAFAANTTGSTSSSGSTAAPAAAPAEKHTSSKACNKQADDKKLTGDARASFVKDCRAGKTSK